jgi:hypothetical protein
VKWVLSSKVSPRIEPLCGDMQKAPQYSSPRSV